MNVVGLDGKTWIWNPTRSQASVDEKNIPLVRHVRALGYACEKGSENDVLERYVNAAKTHQADLIVRITGDCPLVDPELVDKCICRFREENVDYFSNISPPSFPDGMDVQVYSLKSLRKSYRMTTSKSDREHVTLHIRKNPKIFKTIHFQANEEEYWPDLGLTLDEEKDFILIKKVFQKFKNKRKVFSLISILQLLRKNNDLLKINKKVKRKIVKF